jgi:hypothetical protein
VVMAVVLTRPVFWCERSSTTLMIRLASTRIGSYFDDAPVPCATAYADVWPALERRFSSHKRGTVLAALPPVEHCAAMLAHFKTAVTSGKLPQFVPASSTHFWRKTPRDCHSAARLSNCLVSAGHAGIPLCDLLMEDECMMDYIRELDGLVLVANRRVYSISFADNLSSSLAARFIPVKNGSIQK